jgi:L-lactate dehydrogenase (cytochrome)
MSTWSQRRLPRPKDILPLIGKPDRSKSLLQRRLERCASIGDIRELARRKTPRAVFEYTDGAALSESSLRRSREAYRSVEFTPRVLRDVANVDLTVEMMGVSSRLPFAFAPTGFTRMMNHVGEPAVVRVAADRGIPYALSTFGTTSIEELAEASPSTRRWFQLYVSRDRAQAEDFMRRADANGYDTLILTVDTVVGGIRRREISNGLTIPPQLRLSTMADMALHPRWWLNVLTTPPLTFANLTSTDGAVGEMVTRVLDPGVTGEDIAWIRDNWSGKLMVKGIQCLDDALMVADLGVDAMVLSNHGGRQLDMGRAPLELLPEVADAIGDRVEVYIDGGITSGTDIVAALALGARGTLVGRAYLYGLMAGGYDGVARVAEILEKEIRVTMQLLGVTKISELNGSVARLRSERS